MGRTGGPVKALRGFRKTHHSVPDAVNPATLGFLARLCTDELAEEAEAFFQAARQALAYKRKDIALAVTRQILAQKLDETAQGRLIDEAIRELPGKLN